MSPHRAESDKLLRHFIERTKLGGLHRAFLYSATAAIWLTGAGWTLLHRIGGGTDELGLVRHPWEPTLMNWHGAVAVAFTLIVGSLVPVHMRRSWALKRNRASGASLAGLCGFLLASGWGLYYVAAERWRESIARGHLYVGLALPLCLLAHIMIWKMREK
jgi:hypothetical protein